MAWYHFRDPDDPGLDTLATQFHLHPLHIEDARSAGERVKVESTHSYTFALLKTLRSQSGKNEPLKRKIVLFASHDKNCADEEKFFIVIADTDKEEIAAALRRAEGERDCGNPVRLLYLVFDAIVDSYFPIVESLDEELDALQDRVVVPGQNLLIDIFAVKDRLEPVNTLAAPPR